MLNRAVPWLHKSSQVGCFPCPHGSALVIQKPFPAEHPYSSHIPRYAVIPSFESPGDPKRGVDARNQRPKNAEMPSQTFDYLVVHQTKGEIVWGFLAMATI